MNDSSAGMTDHATRDQIAKTISAATLEFDGFTLIDEKDAPPGTPTAALLPRYFHIADALISAGLVVPAGLTDPNAEWGMNARNMRKIVNGLRHPKPPPTGDWCATSHAIELLESWADLLELRET